MRVASSLILAVALVVMLVAWPFGGEASAQYVRFVRGGTAIAERELSALRKLSGRRLERLVNRLTHDRRVERDLATLVLKGDARLTRERLQRAVESGHHTVVVPERAVAARIRVPRVKQALRNNCETAALSMLLASHGERVDQLALQRRLARSGPLDPRTNSDGTLLWGDPNRGFVGRPDGGGSAGGFGVYETPIKSLAERYGVDLEDLTGGPARRVYRALLAGNPVIAWVGLSDGPYRTWETPERRTLTANMGEHTVVLTGTGGGKVFVNDPLSGTRVRWTRPEFELMWERLGRRALSL